jgi:hypothetical protein
MLYQASELSGVWFRSRKLKSEVHKFLENQLPYLVKIIDTFSEDPFICFVIEYIEGVI